jgi:hypothetical protein
MEQSPSWKANESSTIQATSRILWNPGVTLLSQINPVHAPIPLIEDQF